MYFQMKLTLHHARLPRLAPHRSPARPLSHSLAFPDSPGHSLTRSALGLHLTRPGLNCLGSVRCTPLLLVNQICLQKKAKVTNHNYLLYVFSNETHPAPRPPSPIAFPDSPARPLVRPFACACPSRPTHGASTRRSPARQLSSCVRPWLPPNPLRYSLARLRPAQLARRAVRCTLSRLVNQICLQQKE